MFTYDLAFDPSAPSLGAFPSVSNGIQANSFVMAYGFLLDLL